MYRVQRRDCLTLTLQCRMGMSLLDKDQEKHRKSSSSLECGHFKLGFERGRNWLASENMARLWIFVGLIIGGQGMETVNGSAPVNEFLYKYDKVGTQIFYRTTLASWDYDTNISNKTLESVQEHSQEFSAFQERILEEALQFDSANLSIEAMRQFKFIIDRPLPLDEELELSDLISRMSGIYSSAQVCLNITTQAASDEDEDGCYLLTPGLTQIMKTSTNFVERRDVWQGWRRLVGRPLKPLYEKYVELKNRRAQLNNFTDHGAVMRSNYEVETLEADVLALYEELKPLYKQLHAYVRGNLHRIYGQNVSLNGTLPAHVLSDMWGRFWSNLYPLMVPFPEKPNLQPSTETMKSQNLTVERMFHTAEQFYTDLGFEPMPRSFWERSILRKPTDVRDILCHATAWDMQNQEDFRIKMCAQDFSFEDFLTIHHEMGHIVYQMQYRHLPLPFRDGANNGFHEAIGELMAMNAATPAYLYGLGLIDELEEDEESDINFLFSQSLITISTLPFHLVNDLWRWRVFRGEHPPKRWNEEFWKLKRELVGVHPPVPRTSEDLDPPTLFHINQDYTMMRYFTRTLFQFQFAQKLCDISGHKGPFHRCNFAQSQEAGEALGKMLSLGRSVPWQDALESFTGTRKLSAQPILKFFQPLHKWLRGQNEKNGFTPGW